MKPDPKNYRLCAFFCFEENSSSQIETLFLCALSCLRKTIFVQYWFGENTHMCNLSDLDGVLESSILVHVDRLDSLPPSEDHCVVLVVRLTLAHQDLPGELHNGQQQSWCRCIMRELKSGV